MNSFEEVRTAMQELREVLEREIKTEREWAEHEAQARAYLRN